MRLGDYPDGDWRFVATCDTCGHQARVDAAEVLFHPSIHPRIPVAELAIRPCCRDCRQRSARIDLVARMRGTPPSETASERLAGRLTL